jgi:hypothetical protein
MNDHIFVWVTKHALTKGIYKAEVRVASSGKYAHTCDTQNFVPQHFQLGHDAWTTEEEAKTDARNRRDKKITSLHKQIEKLKKMEWP